MVLDSDGLGDIQDLFAGLRGKRYFTEADLPPRFHQSPLAEKDKCQATFRDADDRLYEFKRVKFGLMVVPAAFMRMIKRAQCTTSPEVVRWFDCILM